MKKIMNYLLAVLGLISLSNFSGAYDVLKANTTIEIPSVNKDHLSNFSVSDQDVFFSLFDKLESAKCDKERAALLKALSLIYGENIFLTSALVFFSGSFI